MPTLPENDLSTTPSRRQRRQHKPSKLTYLLIGAVLFFLVALLVLALTQWGTRQVGGEVVTPSATATPIPTPTAPAQTPTPTPTDTVTPTPTPTPSPTTVEVYDFTQPVPLSDAVEADYFADAVFVGDSRTDGLKLYSGISGADFIEHTGITVFEVGDPKKGVRIDGEKYSFLEALELKQYKKVYLMLGVNELGYFNDEGFKNEFAGFVDKIKALQPDAIIYIQNLPAINPDKAKANSQPYYITNEQIAIYNDILAGIAADKRTAFVDVNAALVDETGVVPREGTTDGVHFTKDYYVKWYDCLKTHTVSSELYWAGD